MLLPLLIIVCVAYVVYSLVSIFQELRLKRSSNSYAFHSSVKFIFAGGVPILVTLTMVYLFIIVGGATTVQFNAGSESGMSAWSMWVSLWPLFLLLTAINGVGCLIWLITCICKRNLRRKVIFSIVSLFFSTLSFYTVVSYFPSA